MFKKGNVPPSPMNAKGHKGHGGRPRDEYSSAWIKIKCQNLIKKHKLVEFIADVAAGKPVDKKYNTKGELVDCPADIQERRKCYELLAERAWGKPIQTVEAKIDDSRAQAAQVEIEQKVNNYLDTLVKK